MAKNLNMALLVDVYGPVLTQKQRDMIEMYYYEDLSLAEIAQNCGITRQGVRDAIKRGETVITELEEKLGFARRFSDIEKATEAIERNAKEILECNSKVAYSEPVKAASESILETLGALAGE